MAAPLVVIVVVRTVMCAYEFVCPTGGGECGSVEYACDCEFSVMLLNYLCHSAGAL